MKLSIIVCTRNRVHALKACLDSIVDALQNTINADAEIVIVDNGSTDETASFISSWRSGCKFPVRCEIEPRQGLSRARNCGIRASRGDLLIFTDDDCRMDKDYINSALRHDSKDLKPVLRGGRVELGDASDLPITIKTSSETQRWQRDMDSARHHDLAGSILGCSMVMRRVMTQILGPFNESLGAGTALHAAEDTDYIFKAYIAGIPIEYVPDMVVYHFHGKKSKSEGYKLFSNYAIGNGALYAQYPFIHPDLCRPFYWDLKNAFKEIPSGENRFLPEIGFSYKDKVFYTLKGFFLSIYLLTSQFFAPSRQQ
jgi:glycosyltransferase involved in cell wall biosynthesis